MGGQDGTPIEQYEELQSSRPHKQSQPMEQLDEVVDEIRKMMLGAEE
jgi:hypothetical protein